MGSGTSQPLPDLPTNNYFCITFTMWDHITVLYGSQQERDIVRQGILSFWKNGLQNEKMKLVDENTNKSNCYSYKLSGYPFQDTSTAEVAISVRRMAAKILLDLYKIGWKLLVSSDLSRTQDLSTWVFQRQIVKPDSQPFFSIAFSSWDKLQINDCPPHVLKLIRERVAQLWTAGVQNEKNLDQGSFEIKLKGTPWHFVSKEESCNARHLVREIITLLANNQYMLYANSNLKSTADTLFFQYDQDVPANQEFLTISLNKNDRIRLIHAPDSVIATVEETVRLNWGKGVQEVNDKRPDLFEMKLRGYPWWADGNEAIESRKLVTVLLEKMASIGYFIETGIDITRKTNDKSLLLFRRGYPLATKFFCLSLNSSDYVRLINAPSNIVEAGKTIISHWPLGIQDEKHLYDGVSYHVKLKGNPWSEMFHGDGYHGRALLMALLTSYTALGWRLVCSADVSSKYIHQQNGPDYPLDVHSWYFMYDESLLASPPPPPAGFPAPPPVGFPTAPPAGFPTAPPVGFATPPPTYDATFQ